MRYGLLRHYPLRWLERWVLRRRAIAAMTVSDGLARTIVDWYSCPVPTVVHSALKPLLSGNALAERSRVPGTILFFGTAERLPFELIADLGRAGLELPLSRRFAGPPGAAPRPRPTLPGPHRAHGDTSP